MTSLLRTDDITFSYGKKPLIQALSLQIPEGSCFGLLGHNGAGKSTAMKLMLGLLKPHEGKVYFREEDISDQAGDYYAQLGALIETPSLYPYLTAEQNLRISARYHQCADTRISVCLQKVGLYAQAKQKVSTFSTGMKQRLGIALALLHDPPLLILDEPINGLDPQGIVSVRKLIQQLQQQEGKTILLSSHLLHEVEKTCDHVGILHQGKLLYQGSLNAMRQTHLAQQTVCIETDQAEKAHTALASYAFQSSVQSDQLHIRIEHKADISRIIDILRGQHIHIFQIKSTRVGLEDLYLHFTAPDNTTHDTI